MWNFLSKFRQIDPRIIYLLVFVVIAIPILLHISMPIYPTQESKDLKDFLEKMPPGKLVVIAADWQAGTKGECAPLTAAMMEYLMKAGRPFAIFSLVPQGPELAQRLAEDTASRYHRKYGEDWVNWGFKPSARTTLIAMNQDVIGTIKTDIRHTPLEKVPCMKGVKSLKDVGLVYEVTGSALTDFYLQFVTRAPLALGCTAVIGPEQYPYYISGQWRGLLVGLRGAAEFETLTDFKQGKGLKLMPAQSFAHLLIIVLIIMGNLGMLAARKLGILTRSQPHRTAEGGDSPSTPS